MATAIGLLVLCMLVVGVFYAVRTLQKQDLELKLLNVEVVKAQADYDEAKARSEEANADYQEATARVKETEMKIAEYELRIAQIDKEKAGIESWLAENKQNEQKESLPTTEGD